MDQAPDFEVHQSPPARRDRRPVSLPGSSSPPPPVLFHSQNSRKSLEASRRTETASTPRPSLCFLIAPPPPPPPPALRPPPDRLPTHPGFPDCQKPELEPAVVYGLEAGRTPILAIPGLASKPFSPGITFSSARRSLLLGI